MRLWPSCAGSRHCILIPGSREFTSLSGASLTHWRSRAAYARELLRKACESEVAVLEREAADYERLAEYAESVQRAEAAERFESARRDDDSPVVPLEPAQWRRA